MSGLRRLQVNGRVRSGTVVLSAAWHLAAVLVVALLPTLVRDGEPFWGLPERLKAQVPAVVIGYLGTALFVRIAAADVGGWARRIGSALGAGLVAFGASFLLLVLLPGHDYSRVVWMMAFALGVPLAAASTAWEKTASGMGASALLAVASATLIWGGWAGRDPVSESSSPLLPTALHTLRVTVYDELIEPSPPLGGGLARSGSHYFVANGAGRLWRLEEGDEGFIANPVRPASPLDREAFIADNSLELERRNFRIMDLEVDSTSVPHRLLATHYAWSRAGRCVQMVLSALDLEESGGTDPSGGAWERVFTGEPCVPIETAAGSGVLTNHAGGRMTWAPDGRLLLSLGDMHPVGVDRLPEYPQDPDADYGKILAIDLAEDGTADDVTIVSLGNRNPEGLIVARDGTIWSTEHGPTGGDELNRIEWGVDYGWPVVSYGTEERGRVGPGERVFSHAGYREPTWSWVPSVGVSNLVEADAGQFPAWEGDLVVGSLLGASLFRVRIREGRVVYVERIPLGHEVRDMVSGPDGRLVVLTERSAVLVIENAGNERTAEVVFAGCAACHEPMDGGTAIAPDLRGVVGRVAAALETYGYSDAMRDADLEWTPENLDRFLADPGGFIPGTAMSAGGLSEGDRALVIAYLRGYE